jgi:predicted nucleic acid-binding protein
VIFLLDTSAFSDLMREHPQIDIRLASLSSTDRVVLCSVVRGEIRYGIGRLPQGKRRQALETKANNLFTILTLRTRFGSSRRLLCYDKISSPTKGADFR